MEYKKCRLIAEVGCNHKGDIETAKKFIKIAALYCNIDVIKFQKRNNKELLTDCQYNSPHPKQQNSYGSTYGEHREFLEFTVAQHKVLKGYCNKYGIEYSTSVWDLTSAKEIAQLNPNLIKIPSSCNNNYQMLEWLCDNYKGEIHVSLGMTTRKEENELMKIFKNKKRNKDVVLYACTSGYPTSFEDICLLEISRLKDTYGNCVKEIAFSGHHLGTSVDVAAYALGATTIERHYTLNKNWKGTDHMASLEPDELKSLNESLVQTNKALTYKEECLLKVEIPQREKLKYREI